MPQTLDEDISRLVSLVANVTDAFTAALFLVEGKKGDKLRLRACQSLSNSVVPGAEFPVGHGLVGWVAKTGKFTQAANFKSDTTTLQFYSKDEDIKSFAAAPVLDHSGRVMGVLSVDSKKNYVFTEKMGKILVEFAAALANVVIHGRKRIRLNVEAMALDGLLEVVNRLTACETIAELAQTLRAAAPPLIPHELLTLAVKSFDDEGFYLVGMNDHGNGNNRHTALPLTHYRMGWVIHNSMPVNLPEIDGAPIYPGCGNIWRSFIGAPMVSHDQTVGAVALLSRKPRAFRQADFKALQILAAACSSAFVCLYMHNKEKKSVLRDPLTRLVTHRYLLESMGPVERSSAVLAINVMKFGMINAELGHDGGDEFLMEMAGRLKRLVGDDGMVCRYYGDRFLVFLEDHSAEKAVSAVEGILKSIDTEPFMVNGATFLAPVSVGVATSPEDGRDMEELIAKAHLAADRSKTSPGRVAFFSDTQTPLQFKLRSLER
ncbi:MAG: diguanylate cyclase [Nitrospinae bacterium]|nr:diguanylate cyclase [Nitrospinota bacterium]